jgi:hypothetical protein
MAISNPAAVVRLVLTSLLLISTLTNGAPVYEWHDASSSDPPQNEAGGVVRGIWKHGRSMLGNLASVFSIGSGSNVGVAGHEHGREEEEEAVSEEDMLWIDADGYMRRSMWTTHPHLPWTVKTRADGRRFYIGAYDAHMREQYDARHPLKDSVETYKQGMIDAGYDPRRYVDITAYEKYKRQTDDHPGKRRLISLRGKSATARGGDSLDEGAEDAQTSEGGAKTAEERYLFPKYVIAKQNEKHLSGRRGRTLRESRFRPVE